MLPKRILITGATGLVGRKLTANLLAQGCVISALTRDPLKAQSILGSKVTYFNSLSDKTSLNEFDAVINLAGEPIADKRWTSEQKQKLCDSRWKITEQLSQLIQASETPPSVFISGSAVGYYGDKGDEILTENSQPHPEFTYDLCSRWESLALAAKSKNTRVCVLRTCVILASKGGALGKLLPVFRLGMGGQLGNGRQFMSWIHLDDMVNAIVFLLCHKDMQGPVNMGAPNPIENKVFTQVLSNTLKRPALLRVPSFILKLAMGEVSIVLLGSQRALPEKLEKAGFVFKFPTINKALEDLLLNKNNN